MLYNAGTLSCAVAAMLRSLRVINLAQSLTRYNDGLSLQNSVLEKRKKHQTEDTLILLQHHPVYTIGKRGSNADFRKTEEELKATGADICIVPRGGEVTYHGPGQLVAYPIVDVRRAGLGARAYVESLEDSIINCLAEFGMKARGRVPGATGVWVGERKIAAIGVRITHGISSHGIALNVSTNLSHFDAIVPCGLPDKEVTSLEWELQSRHPDREPQPWPLQQQQQQQQPALGHHAQPSCKSLVPPVAEVAEIFARVFRARLGYTAAGS